MPQKCWKPFFFAPKKVVPSFPPNGFRELRRVQVADPPVINQIRPTVVFQEPGRRLYVQKLSNK